MKARSDDGIPQQSPSFCTDDRSESEVGVDSPRRTEACPVRREDMHSEWKAEWRGWPWQTR
jgi:hypothetical protein